MNHFAGSLAPDEYTLDAVESPRNSNWFLVLIAARRAITFLEQQPEVDPAQIGAYGHSMGGKLTTDLAGIDKRVKAAVPSCGGAGDILESQAEFAGLQQTRLSAMELACISDNAYIPQITCPVLWLSPTNDFHAHIDNMAWNWRNVPDDRVRFSISPHLNHRHTDEHAITQYLWFEQHLKGAFKMPRTPQLVLRSQDTRWRAPRYRHAGRLAARPAGGHLLFHRPARTDPLLARCKGVKIGKLWKAACPVMSLEHPLFAFANVVYETPEKYRKRGEGGGAG